MGLSLGKAKAPAPTTPQVRYPLPTADAAAGRGGGTQSLNPARTAEGPNAALAGPAAAAPGGGGRGARAPRGGCQAGRGPAGARRSRGPRRGCGDQGVPEEGLGGAARGAGPVRLHHRPGALPPLRRERPPPDKHRSPSRLGMVALQHMDFFLNIYHCLVLCMCYQICGVLLVGSVFFWVFSLFDRHALNLNERHVFDLHCCFHLGLGDWDAYACMALCLLLCKFVI